MIYGSRRAIGSKRSKRIAWANTVYESTTNTGFVSVGKANTPTPSKSPIITNPMKKHLNVHPGELLREEFLTPMGITPYRLAKDARLPHQRVNEIVNEKRGITPETDLHLCAYFGLTPGYWLRVQLAYELREALNTVGDKIKALVRPLKAA
jgi:addiction module HigA family antidote